MRTHARTEDGRSIKRPATEYIVKMVVYGDVFVKFHTEIVCKVVHSLVAHDEATRFPTRSAALVLAGMYQLKPGTFTVEQASPAAAVGATLEDNRKGTQ